MYDVNNFSVMSYSFHGLLNVGAMNIFGYLETLKYRYNLNKADIWNGFITDYSDKFTRMLKQNLDERGLSVANLCCDQAHVWDNNLTVRTQNEEMAWKCLNLAKQIGAKTIRIDAGVREETFSDEQLDYVSKKYKEYCAFASEFGAKVGTENHWGVTRNFAELNRLFDAMSGVENFGLLLHLGNWDCDESKLDENDRAMASRAMHMHINYEHCIDADRILPPLMEAGYSGCWSVESHKSTNEYNNVAFQLAQAKRVLAPMNYSGGWENGPPSVNE